MGRDEGYEAPIPAGKWAWNVLEAHLLDRSQRLNNNRDNNEPEAEPAETTMSRTKSMCTYKPEAIAQNSTMTDREHREHGRKGKER